MTAISLVGSDGDGTLLTVATLDAPERRLRQADKVMLAYDPARLTALR